MQFIMKIIWLRFHVAIACHKLTNKILALSWWKWTCEELSKYVRNKISMNASNQYRLYNYNFKIKFVNLKSIYTSTENLIRLKELQG